MDHANKANADAQKNMKRHLEQIKELQMQVEEEQRRGGEYRDQFLNAEKRSMLLQSEKDDFLANLESAERARKQAEGEAHELREQNRDLSNQSSANSAAKRKIEGDLQLLHVSRIRVHTATRRNIL